MPITFTKDPQAVLDYAWDWEPWLGQGETIGQHTVTADPAGLTVDSSSVGGAIVTAWLSGGKANTVYQVGCRITTSAGRTDERSIHIACEER